MVTCRATWITNVAWGTLLTADADCKVKLR